MRFCFIGVVFAILFAGGASNDVVLDAGSSHLVNVMTLGHDVLMCHLLTPRDGTIDFLPGDQTKTTDKYYIENGTLSTFGCSVTIRNIDENDHGQWVISYEEEGGEGRSETYNIVVNGVDGWILSEITHSVRQESEIDISLNIESFKEECFVRPPKGELMSVDLIKLDGVKVQEPSNFVSCRLTIGPMTGNLVGEWRLCAKSVETKKMRCQPVSISWNNNNMVANWDAVVRPKFFHPVHFGGSVNPGVAGRGNVVTCHVITPAGEDLVLTSDVKYPHIERITNNPEICSVMFTDIDRPMLGNWSIAGRFQSTFTALNEVRLPLNFFLYNENKPYEQAYNVTNLHEGIHLVNLGSTVSVTITGSGEVEDCLFMKPTGKSFGLKTAVAMEGVSVKSLDSPLACRIEVGPITKELLGEWQIAGKFIDRNQYTKRQQSFRIIQEDPENPIIEDHRTIENLPPLIVDTKIGASHDVVINGNSFLQHESCHIVTPDGRQYAFIDGFHVDNVNITRRSGSCEVSIYVETEDMLGDWTLISRDTRSSIPIERRQPFSIHVEESVSLGNARRIREGADLYIRLPEVTTLYETCKLYGPDAEEVTDFKSDPLHPYSCGYIVRELNKTDDGIWTILYGNRITYRATVKVNIIESEEISVKDEVWTLGTHIENNVGPVSAVYCRVEDAHGFTVFDGFGSCKILVERVTSYHEGVWTMFVVLEGSVLQQRHRFNVRVQGADSSVVTTHVERFAPSVLLTCSVPTDFQVNGCKFRDPRGNILVASHGVGQDGYAFSNPASDFTTEAGKHDCTLRLTKPSYLDLGLWRCAIDTDQHTLYGFLTVSCPWLMDNENINPAINEPSLKEDRRVVSGLEGDAVVMSCSISSALRYCYFRAQNGTIYNVGPAIRSSGFEYVGAGLEAGECGVRFSSLQESDSGLWSCHVGLINTTAQEQRASITLEINEKMSLSHYWQQPDRKQLVVHASLYSRLPLEYCRFVRIDGFGFTSDNAPPGYEVQQNMNEGNCSIVISKPSMLDAHPWTVAAKITGIDGEISKSTTRVLVQQPGILHFSIVLFFYIILAMLLLILIGAGVSLIPQKNREWTRARASSIRNSFRRTPPPPYTEEPNKNNVEQNSV